jgi:hypothetical protein
MLPCIWKGVAGGGTFWAVAARAVNRAATGSKRGSKDMVVFSVNYLAQL